MVSNINKTSNKASVKWKVEKLGDVAYIKARIGWRGLSAKEYTEEGPYLIAGKHIKGSSINWGKCDHISSDRYEESPEIQLKDGDVIITKDGTIGRLGFIKKLPGPATINGTMMLVRPNSSIFFSKYLYYFFQGSQFQFLIKEKVSGSSVPHLFQRDMVTLNVQIPPMQEQQKITDILTSVDNTISKTEDIIKQTEKVKKGSMQQLLTKGIGHTKFKQTEIGEIPEEWEVLKIEDVCEILDGMRKPIKKADREKLDGDIPYYGASGVIDWVNDFIFDEPLILLGEDGENLRSRVLPLAFKIEGKSWVNNHAHVLRPLDKIDIDFLEVYLESIDYEKYITGSAQPKLNQKVVRNILIAFPTLSEQQKISRVISSITKKRLLELKKLDQLQTLKTGLMQVLLTGKVRVKVNEQEVI